MRSSVWVASLSLLLAAGCPLDGNQSPVDAQIAASSTTGSAPLTVVFSAANSSSTNEGALTYAWDFDDGTTSDQVEVTHVFQQPGRYVVQLTVTDSAGEVGRASVEVRAGGQTPVAVISASVDSGTEPLPVQFDGTLSHAPDDVILDYYWDFGDGTTSRQPQPWHRFDVAGQYTVTLRVVTAGGREATTTTTITVAARNGSLEFNGGSFATLPLGSQLSFAAFTLELWVKAENEGGTLASLGGGALTINMQPASNAIGVQIGSAGIAASATSLAGSWRHVAVVYDGNLAGVCVLYLDGAPLGSTPIAGSILADQLTIGVGFRGKIGEVRLWAEARSSVAILLNRDQRLAGTEFGLLGYWPLFEGTGQVLYNHGGPASNGVLGSSIAVENADPGWSAEGPPI